MADLTIFRSLVTATPRPPKPSPAPPRPEPEPALAGPASARGSDTQLADVDGEA
jgi:hypothetical protein